MITMVKAEHATQLNLTSNDVDPLQLEAPSTRDGEETKEVDNDDAVVVEDPTKRIGWNKPTRPHDTPVFVAMHVMLPLPPGIEPPIGLNIKKDYLPAQYNSLHFPAFKIWFETMIYLYAHNKMQSLIAAQGLFNPTDINPHSVFTGIGFPLVADPWVSTMPLSKDSDKTTHANVIIILCGEKRTAILHLTKNAALPQDPAYSPSSNSLDSNSTIASPAPSQPTGHGVTPVDAAGYKAIFDGLAASTLINSTGILGNTKLTLTKQEQLSESDDVITQLTTGA
jgi:hypothetical protein